MGKDSIQFRRHKIRTAREESQEDSTVPADGHHAILNKINKIIVAQRATIAHLSPMCQGQISFQKIQTHPSFNACSCYMKVSKGFNQKQQRKSGNTIFPIIRSIGGFLRRSRAANSVVGGPIWPKFELIHNTSSP